MLLQDAVERVGRPLAPRARFVYSRARVKNPRWVGQRKDKSKKWPNTPTRNCRTSSQSKAGTPPNCASKRTRQPGHRHPHLEKATFPGDLSPRKSWTRQAHRVSRGRASRWAFSCFALSARGGARRSRKVWEIAQKTPGARN